MFKVTGEWLNGRVAVSKTVGCVFESRLPCQSPIGVRRSDFFILRQTPPRSVKTDARRGNESLPRERTCAAVASDAASHLFFQGRAACRSDERFFDSCAFCPPSGGLLAGKRFCAERRKELFFESVEFCEKIVKTIQKPGNLLQKQKERKKIGEHLTEKSICTIINANSKQFHQPI